MNFTDLFDWLADREGRPALIEFAIRDEHGGLIFPVSIHAELGSVRYEDGVGPGMTIDLAGTLDSQDRLWFDPKQVSEIESIEGRVVRVWLHQRGCVQLAASTR